MRHAYLAATGENQQWMVMPQLCSMRSALSKPIIYLDVDLETKDAKDRTPLLISCDLPVEYYRRAMESGHAAMELINGGADIHAVDDTGPTIEVINLITTTYTPTSTSGG